MLANLVTRASLCSVNAYPPRATAGDDQRVSWTAPPRRRADLQLLLLLAVACALFAAALLVRVRCRLGDCPGPTATRLLDLDAVGGLPRLFTTGICLGVAVVAWRVCAATSGRRALWWSVVAVAGLGLALLKVVSAHSVIEGRTSPTATLALGLAVAVPSLCLLTVAGRAWGVTATVPVAAVLAGYALAALGVDALVVLVEAGQDHVGALSRGAATFVEEFGEALAALAVLAVVRRGALSARRAAAS